MKEELFLIQGYEVLYSITRNGRIWSHEKTVFREGKGNYKTKAKWLKFDSVNGYKIVSLSKNKKRKRYYVHRLVGQTFLPNLENKPEINHINLNKGDNRVENLEWCYRFENYLHAKINGRFNHIHKRKCTNEQIDHIRKNHPLKGAYSIKIWKQYNISRPTYYAIINKKGSYKHV